MTWICLLKFSWLSLPCFLEPCNVLFPLQCFHKVIVPNNIDEALETLEQTQLKCWLSPLVVLWWTDENDTGWDWCRQCGPFHWNSSHSIHWPKAKVSWILLQSATLLENKLIINLKDVQASGSWGLGLVSVSFNTSLGHCFTASSQEWDQNLHHILRAVGLCHQKVTVPLIPHELWIETLREEVKEIE